MRKVAAALAATAAGLIALFSFKSHAVADTTLAPAGGAVPQASSASGTGSDAADKGSSPASKGGASKGAASTGATSTGTASTGTESGSSAKSGTFTGGTANTPYGPVQVSATVASGKLTAVKVLQVPDNGRYEEQIVAVDVPELTTEALSAQSSHIDSISGATYTSQGYMSSLQSALDQAGV